MELFEFSVWFMSIIINTEAPHPDERFHNPDRYKPPPDRQIVGHSEYFVPDYDKTPDFRVPEPAIIATQFYPYLENYRPYRLSPFRMMINRDWVGFRHDGWAWWNKEDLPHLMGCYCTTVYKMFTTLAGCAVLTKRHILTTASSTERALRDYLKSEDLIESAKKGEYSSYRTPNISHPFPSMDLAVWTLVKRCHDATYLCHRAEPHRYYMEPTTPRHGQQFHLIGFQWIRNWKRNPIPFARYAMRLNTPEDQFEGCPKGWGWFHCMDGEYTPLGIEGGAALHFSNRRRTWRNDGLAALAAFSLKLRSHHMVNYFTVINTHTVLEFLYDSYMGKLPVQYLDNRFTNTKGGPPTPNPEDRFKDYVWEKIYIEPDRENGFRGPFN